ncbi:zinc ribbon domain-containing protein [Ruminococcus sp.]|uniref:zinc ribbon domain-containing protein n=1 Tax=Ruminococcus sp. TaxID=41978 RepID=UPI0025E1D7F9|nr:zinc ribbon domain-containing protein [Ruminococcus sp.]
MNTIKFCSKCGASIGPEEKFCGGCGASVAQMEAEAAAQAGQNAAAAQAPVQQAQPKVQYNAQQAYENPQNMAAPQAAAAAKPNPLTKLTDWVKNNKKISLIIAAALVVVIVAIIIICNILKYQVIDAKDLFKIEFKGVDGCGIVEAELNCYDEDEYAYANASSVLKDNGIDTGDLFDDYGSDDDEDKVSKYFALDKKTLTKAFDKADDFAEAKQMRNALLKQNKDGEYKIKIKAKDNKNLKNGDKVKFTVTYNEDTLKSKNIKLKNTEFEMTVKDLEKGEEIDFFKGIDVSFTGFDGHGAANISENTDGYPFIYYDYSYDNNLSNGDKFPVTAVLSVYSDMHESGDMTWFEYDDKYYTYKTADVKDKKVTKDFTVEGLKETSEVDPFEGIKFECRGGVPFVKPYAVKEDSIPDVLKDNVYYTVECDDYIGVGGKFKVTCKAYSSLAENGVTLKGKTETDSWGDTVCTTEITVDDTFPAYVTSDNGEAAMENYRTVIEDKIQELRKDIKGSSAPWGTDFDGKVTSIESFDKVDTYVQFTKKQNYDSWNDTNKIIELYKVTVKTDDKKTKTATFYAAIYCSNIVFDGENYTEEPGFSSKYYNDEKAFKEDMVDIEGYTVTKAGAAATDDKKDDSSSKAETTAITTTTTAADKTAKDDSAASKDSETTTTTTTKKASETTTTTLVP